jgi:hypothetical protein
VYLNRTAQQTLAKCRSGHLTGRFQRNQESIAEADPLAWVTLMRLKHCDRLLRYSAAFKARDKTLLHSIVVWTSKHKS